jgi:hypothetical protein
VAEDSLDVKRPRRQGPNMARELAGSTGLEPAASGVTGRRSNQLNYDPEREDLRIRPRWAAWLSHRRRAGERRLVGGTGFEPVTAGV